MYKVIILIILSFVLTGCGGGGGGGIPTPTNNYDEIRQIVIQEVEEVAEYYEIDNSRWGNSIGENYLECFIANGNGTYRIVAVVWLDGNDLYELRPMDVENMYLGPQYVNLFGISDKLSTYPWGW